MVNFRKLMKWTGAKTTILAGVGIAIVVTAFVLQRKENARLNQQLTDAREENARLSSAQTSAQQAQAENKEKLNGLEAEVLRLREAAGRASMAETQIAKIKAAIGQQQNTSENPAVPTKPILTEQQAQSLRDILNNFAPKILTADEVRSLKVEELFDQIGEKEAASGYRPHTSLHALIQKAKESDATKDEILHKAADIIGDAQQNAYKRWQSCYVLSGIGDSRGIAPITSALKDENDTIRGVAVCALGASESAPVMNPRRGGLFIDDAAALPVFCFSAAR